MASIPSHTAILNMRSNIKIQYNHEKRILPNTVPGKLITKTKL